MNDYVTLVGCAASKGDVTCRASDLYTSPLFRKARAWAEALSADSWYIVSGKHGLLAPGDLISPYDYSLDRASSEARRNWAETVASGLIGRGHDPEKTVMVILAGGVYASSLLRSLEASGFSCLQPMEKMALGARLHVLDATRTEPKSWLQLEEMYSILSRLHAVDLFGRRLETGKRWPSKGVYFFHEEGETRYARKNQRIVRVGTHSVSQGSRATLWSRLKTHYGDGVGGGNHRSSIFRLHVGRAIMQREAIDVPSWGLSHKVSAVLEEEASIESHVSDHIRRMRVTIVPIGDESTAHSDRSFIERNAIALLSTAGRLVDPPSPDWLGNWSAHASIRESGLWNLDHVGTSIDPRFLQTLSRLVDNALKGSVTEDSIAPHGWHHTQRQEALFASDLTL